jgi:chromate transporter
VGVAVVALNLLGLDEILLLFCAGTIGLLWSLRAELYRGAAAICALPMAWIQMQNGQGAAAAELSLTGLGLFFLKIGSILYGSGYVLMSFLQGGLVDTRHWLTQSQLIDAVAVGQFTPGPLSSTATFIGYVLLGLPGAGIATLGIFTPSFVFVGATLPFIDRVRTSPLARGFLDGVNAASLGLMLAVTIKLSAVALHGIGAIAIFILSAASLFLWNLNAAWIVLGASVIGWIFSLLG